MKFAAWYDARYFHIAEFACKCGCGLGTRESDTIPALLLFALDRARDKLRVPLRVNSGWRCALHNKRSGGVQNSKHLVGRAADISVVSIDFDRFSRIVSDVAAEVGEKIFKIIYHRGNNFLHVEM